MLGVSRRMLQMGELPRDLFKREDVPQVAALAVPPLRGLRHCRPCSRVLVVAWLVAER